MAKNRWLIYLLVILVFFGGIKLYANNQQEKNEEAEIKAQKIAETKKKKVEEQAEKEKQEKYYIEDKTGSKRDMSKTDDENLFTEAVKKESEELAKKEENWDSNRVERDGEHRTKLSDDQIGSLTIDRIGMKEPLYSGSSELNLRRGGATVDYKEPLDEQTTAIAGHVGGKVHSFTNIKSLSVGDLIKINDFKNKKTYNYKVEKTYTVSPTARYILKDNKKRKERKLLIITCHNYDLEKHFYTERWIVEAYEVK